ncbi:hypothetical protein DFH27DRAFT_609179 [Peziza echinospora]|nr:hypothetical protein DFH27DRAFT_609179 [Peziza echinospora]
MLFTRTSTLLLRAATRRASATTTTHFSPAAAAAGTTRSLTLLSLRRPTTTTFLPPSLTPTTSLLTPPTTLSPSQTLDLLPRPTSHPGLTTQQIRCGPRNTFDPSHFVRKRRVGFLARIRSRTGRQILKRRRLKGRRSLTH